MESSWGAGRHRFGRAELVGGPARLPTTSSQIAYVLGNHDSALPFRAALRELAHDHSRFGWPNTRFGSESELFLHGDVLDAGHTWQALEAYRARFAAEPHARGICQLGLRCGGRHAHAP